jgi:hypothetical protein
VKLKEFWAPAGPIREFATDPHVLYDRAAVSGGEIRRAGGGQKLFAPHLSLNLA